MRHNKLKRWVLRSFGWWGGLLVLIPGLIYSQEIKRYAGTSNFLVSGYGTAKYEVHTEANESDGFGLGFNPIILYRHNDNLLFEAEFEYEFEGDEQESAVEYAQADWIVNDYTTLVAGKFLTPFGTFIERLHPTWVNKLPSAPGFLSHHDSFVPMTQVGAQLRGGIPLPWEHSRLTYAFYLSNGVRSSTSTVVGEFHDNFEDENDNKAIGGRLGIVPLKRTEIGFSAYSGDFNDLNAQARNLRLLGVDAEYAWDVVQLRGELISSTRETTDTSPDLKATGYYLQASSRLSIIPAGFYVSYLTPLELVYRFSGRNFDGKTSDSFQHSIGLNYYLNPSTVWRIGYDHNVERGGADEKNDKLTVMLAVGF